jgi:hypothetical protein
VTARNVLCSIETGWFLNNRYLQGNHLILEGVFRIRNVLIRIRIRRSVPLASQNRTNTSVSLILSAFIFRSRSLISCHIVWVKLRTKAVSHANVYVPAVKRFPAEFFLVVSQGIHIHGLRRGVGSSCLSYVPLS